MYIFIGCYFLQCVDHGFPSKPSALAYDPKLNLLAIGTKSGVIKVYPLNIVLLHIINQCFNFLSVNFELMYMG